jgi:hypothetical protein
VIVPWPADLPPGKYSVAFRVVSEDGHPVTGQVTFSYTDVATPTVEPTVEPTPAAEPESTPQTPQTSEATDTEPSPELIAAEDAGQPNNSLIGPLLIAGAVIVGLGVVISVIMLARSRQ